MGFAIVNPGSFQNPDAGQGGNAVTGASVTGHSSSTATGSGGNSETKSCRWFSFPSVSGVVTAITLKITHTSSGTLSGPSPGNEFSLEYSTNGGAGWNTAVLRTGYTGSQGPTVFSVGLSAAQDISQVQVRDKLTGVSIDGADIGTATATISGIQLEVTTIDQVKSAMLFW